MHFPIAGVEVNPFALVLIGFTVGVCGAFFGIGGAFMVTPALNLLGFPMASAIGTDLAHTMGKSLVATLKHRLLGNIDFKLGGLMVLGTVPGVELGKRLIMHFERTGQVENVVRYTYVVLLVGIGAIMMWELARSRNHRHENLESSAKGVARVVQRLNVFPVVSLPRSRIKGISFWAIWGIGFATGIAAGFLGVGAGFIRVPALMYLMGVPTLVAVGTDLFEIMISSAYGSFTYSMAGRVDIMAALIMLLGAGVGAHIGANCTSYVESARIKLYFASAVLIAAVSVILKQLSVNLAHDSLKSAATYLILVAALIISMVIIFTALLRLRKRRQEPAVVAPQFPKPE